MLRDYVRSLRFENHENYQVRIDQQNESGIAVVLLFDALILAAKGLTLSLRTAGSGGLPLQLSFLAVGLPVYLWKLKGEDGRHTLWIYLYEIILMVLAAFSETIGQPEISNVTFMFLLLVMPPLILDQPWRVVLMILALTVFYGVLDGLMADPMVLKMDLIHLIMACLLSIAVSLSTLAIRIDNLNFTGYYAQKADQDPLTGLYNRFGAERHLDLNHPGLLVYMDLDHFKEINDRYGHATGDRVLVAAADALRACFRKDDILIRMGGDEFAVYAKGTWTEAEVSSKMEHLRSLIHEIHTQDDQGEEVTITTSIGCAYAPRGCLDLDQLIHAADEQMYDVKASGRDSFRMTEI